MIIISQIITGIAVAALFIWCLKTYKIALNTKVLVTTALLVVISVLLGTYLKISLPLFGPESFEIKFDTLPIMIVGYLFGPVVGMVSGLVIDLIQLILFPSGFPYFGFTANLMLTGALAGILFNLKSAVLRRFIYLFCRWVVILVGCGGLIYIHGFMALSVQSKWLITACLLLAFGFVELFLRWISKIESDKEISHNWMSVVIACQILVETLLTSTWLLILFNIPFEVSILIRLVKSCFMIAINVFIGVSIYRLVLKRIKG